jgi:hypothetical protein
VKFLCVIALLIAPPRLLHYNDFKVSASLVSLNDFIGPPSWLVHLPSWPWVLLPFCSLFSPSFLGVLIWLIYSWQAFIILLLVEILFISNNFDSICQTDHTRYREFYAMLGGYMI